MEQNKNEEQTFESKKTRCANQRKNPHLVCRRAEKSERKKLEIQEEISEPRRESALK